MATKQKIWKCRICKKEFARKNQSHKCEIVDINFLFYNKDPALRDLYEDFLSKIRNIGSWTVTASRKAITLYAACKVAFLGIEIRKSHLDIWFAMDKRIDEFPVFRILQASKDKFGHFVRLQSKDEIDDVLINWIKQSYNYITDRQNRK